MPGGHLGAGGKAEGVAHTGHHERRERAGRARCSAGVATKSCPMPHTHSSHTSAAGGIWLSMSS